MINIAQVGVGYWGPNLLRNLIDNPKCKLMSVVDLSDERRKYVSEAFSGIKVTDSLEEVLNDKRIDAIVISTPVKTHYDIALKCIKSGKNVLVEKPMATKSEEIKIINQLSSERKLVAMVGHTFLYNSAVEHVKKIIDSGELGEVRYIYSQRLNLGRIRDDVDALWNLAPHDVSIIQFFLDEQEPISAHRIGQSYVQEDIDDVVFLSLKYPNDILANIHVSWLDPNKVRKITVVGSKKMVVYDDIDKNKIKIFDKGIDKVATLGNNMDFDTEKNYEFVHRFGDVSIPRVDWVEPLKSEINHFIDCIANDTPCKTDAVHAEKVVKILESVS